MLVSAAAHSAGAVADFGGAQRVQSHIERAYDPLPVRKLSVPLAIVRPNEFVWRRHGEAVAREFLRRDFQCGHHAGAAGIWGDWESEHARFVVSRIRLGGFDL